MINISKNKKIIALSKDTIAPISYVPLIILHINGVPFMRHDGPTDITSMKNFIIEMSNKLPDKSKFSGKDDGSLKEDKPGYIIPDYSLGIPLKGKSEVSYLFYDDAYKEEDIKV